MGPCQIIKFEQNLCNAKLDDNEILFVRVNDVVNSPKAKIEVPITHNAIVIKGGGDMRYYKSGTYDVFDNRKEVKNWKKGMSVEVVYIPKDTRVPIKWGTPNRLLYRDDASNKVISIGARGEFDVSVSNPEQFFRKVVGAKKEFNIDEFRRRFSETVATEFADLFIHTITQQKLTYDKFVLNKKAIAENMGAILSPGFEKDWGLSVLNFKIADFDLDDSDIQAIESAAADKQKKDNTTEYLNELERLDDKQWEREKFLRQLELQDKNAYYEVLKIVGKNNSVAMEDNQKNICPFCGFDCDENDKYCPRCGKRISKEPMICPVCGKANAYNAIFCANCGKKLTEN